MFWLARSATRTSRQIVSLSRKAVKLNTTVWSSFQHARSLSGTADPECRRGLEHCPCKYWRDATATKAAKLRALGAEEAFPEYDPGSYSQVRLMQNWYAAGPPPLHEYRLSFGKYKGKRLDEVPDMYLVKFLIPQRHCLSHKGNVVDYVVVAALDDHLKRHPELKSQAGNKKTVVREAGIPTPVKRKRKSEVSG